MSFFSTPQKLVFLVAAAAVGLTIQSPGWSWKQTKSTDTNLPLSWESSCFYYSLNEDGSDSIAFNDLAALAKQSFDAWQNVTCSYYQFVQTAPSAVDEVSFHQDKGNVNLLVWRKTAASWNHSLSAVALTTVKYDQQTGEILDADIEFNEAHYLFGSQEQYPIDTDLIDLPSTMTHEIGHTIGLDHSSVHESTMFAVTDPGDTNKRTLSNDDIEGLCHIYPLAEDPQECEEPYCGLDLDGTSIHCADGDNDSGCRLAPTLNHTNRLGLIGVLVGLFQSN